MECYFRRVFGLLRNIRVSFPNHDHKVTGRLIFRQICYVCVKWCALVTGAASDIQFLLQHSASIRPTIPQRFTCLRARWQVLPVLTFEILLNLAPSLGLGHCSCGSSSPRASSQAAFLTTATGVYLCSRAPSSMFSGEFTCEL
jgi:hypothetical protein